MHSLNTNLTPTRCRHRPPSCSTNKSRVNDSHPSSAASFGLLTFGTLLLPKPPSTREWVRGLEASSGGGPPRPCGDPAASAPTLLSAGVSSPLSARQKRGRKAVSTTRPRVQDPAPPRPAPRGPTCALVLVLVVRLLPLVGGRGRTPRFPAALAPPSSARSPPPFPRRRRALRGLLGRLLRRLLLQLPLSGPALQPLQQRASPTVCLGLRPGRLGASVPRDMEERHAGQPALLLLGAQR